MAFENGRLYTCDRCGAQAFVRCTGEGEADGGYTRWNKFEPLDGWSINPDFKNLCPTCTAQWNKLIEKFMTGMNP